MIPTQSPKAIEFNCLYKELNKIYHEIALKAGLSDSAFSILYSIAELGDGCLQKDIADQYSISRQTINSSIKNLEAKGYLSLRPGKGRDMHIYLTGMGQQFSEERIYPVLKLENDIFTELSASEGDALLRLSRKYVSLYRRKADEFI